MPDRNPKINRLLIFITVFLCLICGLLFTQSSAGPFGNNYNSVVTGNTDDISIMASNSGHIIQHGGFRYSVHNTISGTFQSSGKRKCFSGSRKRHLDSGWIRLEISCKRRSLHWLAHRY